MTSAPHVLLGKYFMTTYALVRTCLFFFFRHIELHVTARRRSARLPIPSKEGAPRSALPPRPGTATWPGAAGKSEEAAKRPRTSVLTAWRSRARAPRI